MFPVIFSIGKFSVYSYGILLSFGFLLAIFLVWRLSRAWDMDEEKVLDLSFLSLLGGLIISRLIFVAEHFSVFLQHSPLNVIMINRTPGFSFWGGIVGGTTLLYLLTGRKKDAFFQALDIASVGLIGGLIFASLGCFFGGCDVGIQSHILALPMAGAIGSRFPVQILEALLLIWALSRIWGVATHFHQRGKIFSLSLIYIGLIQSAVTPLKQNAGKGLWLALFFLLLGIYLFYKVTKRKLFSDLKLFFTLDTWKKYWYNQVSAFSWNLRNSKKFVRRLNVRLSYKNNKQS